MTIEKKCEFCDKRGVPILPLRYAIAPAGAGAPAVATVGIVPSATAAHYTRRLLRAGYLYVYDEARDRWETYFVTAQSLFFKLAETAGAVPVLPDKPFDCPDEGHRAVASCITIRDARRATKVWIGFSDMQWTPAVREKHQSADYRVRHMRCIDVNARGASPDAAHCLGLHTVGAEVAEYAMARPALQRALGWSPFALDPRKDGLPRLIREAENLAPGQGMAVVLEDPVGIAAELDVLMQRNLNLFVNAGDNPRRLAVAHAVRQIEDVVRAQAVEREEAAAEQLANQMLGHSGIGMLFEGFRERRLAEVEAMRTVDAIEAKRVEDSTWSRYAVKFDEAAMDQWKQSFDRRLQAHDADFIAPLAIAHAAWMRSGAMAAAFECNADETNAHSGIAYAKTLQLCLGGTQDKAACFDLYAEWLDGDVTDKQNLLLRALALNLEATAQEIQAAAAAHLDWRGLPLDGLVAGFGKATETVAAGLPDAVGGVIVKVLGPLARLVGQAADGPVRGALVAIGLYTQQGFVVVEVTGSKKAFRTTLIRQLRHMGTQVPNERQMERAVAAELRRLERAGVPLRSTGTRRFLLMVDPEQVRAMPAGLNAPARAQWLAASIRTPAQLDELNLSNWQAKVRNPTVSALRGSVPYVAGLIGAVIQYNMFQKLSEDERQAMSHERTEATVRVWAGVGALGGTITELVGQGLGKIASITPRFARGLGFVSLAATWAGKAAGVGGALVMAGCDVARMVEARQEKQYGLMVAYGASAALGVVAAVALLLGATGVGLVLVGLLIVVTVLIEYFKDNKVQDWLERCVWGHGPAARYSSAEEEMTQLRTATAN